jgi:predicted nucleic acid-binding protein
MVKALLDTNILIDYLNAVPQARAEIKKYDRCSISVVSWMEVLVGAPRDVENATRAFLDGFAMIALDDRVAERAVSLRRRHGIKLPDAIIWASADVNSLLLVTRNTKDFGDDLPGVRVPYRLV